MTAERTITGSKAELVAFLRERQAYEDRVAESEHTQKDNAYRRGVADGLDLAIDALEDWEVAP